MSDKLREAAKAALEELITSESNAWNVINDLEAALAEPIVQESLSVAEPVAWMSDSDVGFYKEEFGNYPCVPLYAAPPRREWVGLTAKEIDEIEKVVIGFNSLSGWENEFGLAIETKLKEKNS
jgi:hypothetical protein